MSRLLTKLEIDTMYSNLVGTQKDENYGYINSLLYNLVLKKTVPFEFLTLREKQSLVMILEGDHKTFFFDEKMKIIRYRGNTVPKKEEQL